MRYPIVINALFRYRLQSQQRAKDQSPERLALADVPLLVTAGLWLLIVVAVVYIRG